MAPGYSIRIWRGMRNSWPDTVNMAKRVKCRTFITAGLGDYICPPSGVSLLYNNLKAPKTIEYMQGTTHMYDAPKAQKQTLKSN